MAAKRIDIMDLRQLLQLKQKGISNRKIAQILGMNRSQFLLDLIEQRTGKASTIICSQIPVSSWHEMIGEGTIADAILDRVVYSSHRIELKGESLRRKQRLNL